MKYLNQSGLSYFWSKIASVFAKKVDVFTKTETNTLLNAKANVSNTYVKSEVYTQTETDNKLSLKANKTETYTKEEVNVRLAGKATTTSVDDLNINKQDKLTAGANISISGNTISSSTNVTYYDVTIQASEWTNYPNGSLFKAYIHKNITGQFLNAKMIQISFVPADLTSRNLILKHGIILETVYNNDLWFVCSESLPTADLVVRVVCLW